MTGTVEVDKTYIGGEEPELLGGRAKGKKALVGIAVEVQEPKRVRGGPGGDLGRWVGQFAAPFVTEHVEPGARVITEGWAGYRGIDKLGYRRRASG